LLPLDPGFVSVASPDIDEAAIEEVVETLRSGWVIAGPKVGAFERLLGDRLGAPHLRCLSSCTAGLFLALRLAGVGSGDEVLVPSVAFVACANVVVQLGATPVFVDCEPDTGLVDLDHAAMLVGPRTGALIALHLGGRPLDMERLNEFRDRHGLLVVEDAAHAIGAAWGEQPIGAHGNPTAFSFHATKNMTTIEGGALVLQSEALAERVRRLAHQGISASAWQRHGSNKPAGYDVIEPGYKLGMTDVEAAIGIHQLRRLDEAIDCREALATAYDAAFADLPVALEPPPPPGVRHARHLYRLLVEDDAPLSRDGLIRQLRAQGIGSSIHFQALHQLTCFRQRLLGDELPASVRHALRTISLPLHPALAENEQDRVVEAVRAALGGA
jgi:dTDP-4-amino-4,6-dideoxygalactose transaminase